MRRGPPQALSAWPLPYRGGNLSLSFATMGGLGGGPGTADLALFDIKGRLVRTLAQGGYPAGILMTSWDGRDAGGRDVPNGVYFLRAQSGGESNQIRVVVVR